MKVLLPTTTVLTLMRDNFWFQPYKSPHREYSWAWNVCYSLEKNVLSSLNHKKTYIKIPYVTPKLKSSDCSQTDNVVRVVLNLIHCRRFDVLIPFPMSCLFVDVSYPWSRWWCRSAPRWRLESPAPWSGAASAPARPRPAPTGRGSFRAASSPCTHYL